MRLIPIYLFAFSLTSAQDDDDRRMASAASIEAGHKLFQEACGACHGQNGGGGHGPSLVDRRQIRDASNAQLFQTIQNGIKGTGMPPSPLPKDRIEEIVAFVRNLGAPAIDSVVSGDAQAGKALFAGRAGCSGCHSIAGTGGVLGPDLTDAGAHYTLPQLTEALLQPNRRIAPGFPGLTVVTVKGATITGVARNHDNYSLQILDKAGKLHLFAMSDLKSAVFLDHSLMPADYAKKLTEPERQNILAFLSRQFSRQ